MIQNYPETQPQVAQLEILYNGPLIKDSMVEKLDDLLVLKNKYHYPHKRVWVKDQAAEYYLESGDGTSKEHWKRSIARMTVNTWDYLEHYNAGDVVSLNMKMYYALKNVPAGINPLSDETYWGVLTGEIETYRYTFESTSSVIIYTEIKNPMFQIIKGDFAVDEQGEPAIDEETGYLKLENQEIIEAEIIFREDLKPKPGDELPDNEGGNPYEIRFFENETPVELSGVINVK